MRYINIKMAQPGMILGKDIMDENGSRPLIKRNVPLTDAFIERLKNLKIGYICIDDELSSGVEVDEVIPLSLRNTAISCLEDLKVDKIVGVAKQFTDNLLSVKSLPVDIYNIVDDDTFNHSIAVAEVSVAIATKMEYDSVQLRDVAVSALLQDIGIFARNKATVEELITDKTIGKLEGNDKAFFDNYREEFHPFYGYYLLLKNRLVNSTVKHAVFEHHENMDGTGTFGFSKNRIYEYARIIHIADAFIQLITNTYPDFKAKNTNDVIEYIRDNSGTKFDSNIVNTFFDKVPIYPPGIMVDLSDGRKAIIVKNNKELPTRPEIIVVGNDKEKINLKDADYQSLIINGVSDPDTMVIENEKHL